MCLLILLGINHEGHSLPADGSLRRPPFVDAWFGPDFPLSAGRSIAISATQEALGVALPPAPGFPTVRIPHLVPHLRNTILHPGILPFELRETFRNEGMASGTLLLCVDFVPVDLPWACLAWVPGEGTEPFQIENALFFQAEPRFSQRRAWFLLEDIDRVPPARKLHFIGQAGLRVISFQFWRLGKGGAEDRQAAAIRASFQRMLQRPPTPNEFRLARQAMLSGQYPNILLFRRLATSDEFRERFVLGTSRIRVIERLHYLFHGGPILPERLIGALGAWRGKGFDDTVDYLLFMEESVLDNPAGSDHVTPKSESPR